MIHCCHATGCCSTIHPTKLMCPNHWRMVPRAIKLRIFAAYRPGQCDDKKPSKTWIKAARDAQMAVEKKEGK